MRASDLNWDRIPNFSPAEWPEGVLEYMDDRIIYALSDVREESRCPIWPSTDPEAHVRHSTSDSRHSTLLKHRLVDATDFFSRWQDAQTILKAILQNDAIGGIGIYDAMKFDGPPGELAMFHIDCRPVDLVCWWGEGRNPVNYIYMNPKELKEKLKNFLEV